MTRQKCDQCGGSTYGMVILTDLSGKIRHLCNDCYNKEMAGILGIDNFNDFIKTYQAKDADGNLHTFQIRKHIFPMGIKWLAYETKNGEIEDEGYQFYLYADLDENPLESLQRLYKKIVKGLSVKYIKEECMEGCTIYSLPHDKLVGRIQWDDDYHGELPKIIVDGKAYTWYQIGKMLMAYEG